MTQRNDDQSMVHGKHIGYFDPEGLDQARLEEGLGDLVASLRREIDRAEAQAHKALEMHNMHQSRAEEMAQAAAWYRQALGLPPLAGMKLGFTLAKLRVAEHHPAGMVPKAPLDSEGPTVRQAPDDTQGPGASNG